MLARLPVPDQFLGAGVEVLFGTANAFPEWRRRRLVEDLDAAAGAFGDVHLVEPRVLVAAAR